MSARPRTARRIATFAGIVIGAAACVEISSAEQGVLSIRLDPLPPSIVAGDTLRDSTGAVLRLHGVAFNETGDSVSGAAFTYGFVPTSRDTATGGRPALVVDATTGLVRADSLPGAAQARVSARFGERLQVLDTIAIVRRPTRLVRVDSTDTATLSFLCIDESRELRVDSAFATVTRPLAVRLTGDSAGQAVPVPSYLVRYRITTPATVPSGRSPYGDTRPALYLTNGRADRPLGFDTTNTTGQTQTALRVLPTLLTAATTPDTVRIEAQAFVAGRAVGDAVPFRVRLVRRTSSLAPCP